MSNLQKSSKIKKEYFIFILWTVEPTEYIVEYSK